MLNILAHTDGNISYKIFDNYKNISKSVSISVTWLNPMQFQIETLHSVSVIIV